MATAKSPRAKSAPITAEKATPTKGYTIKQNLPERKKIFVYTLNKGGGIWYSLPQNGVTVFDDASNTVRQIRYCPNEPSIYTDEQSANALRQHVVFENGIISVPYTQPNLINYLNSHPSNKVNGGGLFQLVDNDKTAEEELEVEFKQHEAISLVRDKDITELLPVAMYLSINISQETMGIKRELLRHAKSSPTSFIKMFDNPMVKMRSAIMQASEFQILSSRPDGMFWFDTGTLIVSTPAGMDTGDVMTRFCNTEKGAPVYEQIVARLNEIA
jgi:hypothetical protein|tara:strand:+ start:178 stop:993 length:816 start_codon:yes stop_codon:yes gene_type:complete